jgi:hypothetical protein
MPIVSAMPDKLTKHCSPQKKALDIRQRLARQNPDRHEPVYATSLSNYGEFLAAAGHYAQAIAAQAKVIDISQRLYLKLPQKHAFHFARCHLFTALIQWLNGDSPATHLTAVDADLTQYLAPHQQPVIELLRLFVAALSASGGNDLTAIFTQIMSLYQPVTHAQKNQIEQQYHCVAAWLYHRLMRERREEQEGREKQEKQMAQWQAFKAQRQNNLPMWMLDVAKNWQCNSLSRLEKNK